MLKNNIILVTLKFSPTAHAAGENFIFKSVEVESQLLCLSVFE